MAASEALKALEAEAGTEGADFTVVALRGKPVRVKPASKWSTKTYDFLQDAKVEKWAKGALYGDDYTKVWDVVEPTMDEAGDFLTAWGTAAGENPGD
jgi:hypothetical protein